MSTRQRNFVAVNRIVGSSDVHVVAIADGAGDLTHVGADCILPVYYRAGSYEPSIGERVATWVDVSATFAMASRS